MSCSLRRGRSRAGRERGAVTAEFAIVLPAVVLLVCVVSATGVAAWTQIRCVDAAAAAARLAARGESQERVLDVARRLGPDGAQISITGGGSDGGGGQVAGAGPVVGGGAGNAGVGAGRNGGGGSGPGSGGGDVTVTVRTTLGLPLPGTPRLQVSGTATTPREVMDAGP